VTQAPRGGGRPGSSRMARACPRRKPEVPGRLQPRPGAGGLPRPGRPATLRASDGASASFRLRVPGREYPSRDAGPAGHAPVTAIRFGLIPAPDRQFLTIRTGAAGRSGRLSAQSHPICVPQHADRHDAAIGADQRLCARVATGDRNACYRLAAGGLGWCYAAGRPRQAIAAGLLLSVVTVRRSGGVACCGPARCRPSRRAAARRR